MATLNLDKDEFADIAMIWLFDQVMNPENITNEDMKEFVEQHGVKIKTPLMKYYLDSRGEQRIRYKRIKGVFTGDDKAVQQIRIGPKDKIAKVKSKKKGIIRKIIGKVLAKEDITMDDEIILREMDYYE